MTNLEMNKAKVRAFIKYLRKILVVEDPHSYEQVDAIYHMVNSDDRRLLSQ